MSNLISLFLISGASHTGKSTLAKSIAKSLGWDMLSTDKLGRHPGRPWPKPKHHVFEYYTKLTDESIYQFLLNHYENLRPRIIQTISGHMDIGTPLVLEGSAIRPEFVVEDFKSNIAFICLTSDADLIKERIHKESSYDQLQKEHRYVIDKFINRTLRDNEVLGSSIAKLGLKNVDMRNEEDLKKYSTNFAGEVIGQLPDN